MKKWQFWIDRGGTFTDIVARRPDGTLEVRKVLSDVQSSEGLGLQDLGLQDLGIQDSVLQGIRDLLESSDQRSIPHQHSNERLENLFLENTPIESVIESVKLGTTVATNALLERKGERTVLAITGGFRDALRIGYQNRPDIFALEIVLPDLLYEQVVEISERYSAAGVELEAVNGAAVRQDLQQVYDQGIRSIAIALMHGYRYPEHEKQVAAIAREVGFTQISVSHEVSPLVKLISRADTTVADAYLSPVLHHYLDGLKQGLGNTRLLVMQSNGGLVDAQAIQGKDAILSGPAGGVVGAVKTCAADGITDLIGFDMGGTSTDVCHYSNKGWRADKRRNGQGEQGLQDSQGSQDDYERVFDTEVAGVRLRSPMMAIHTVAAGGGSLLTFDGAKFRVGPESAGANPGPACYRQGGALTVTDCNVLVGKIQPQFFPQVFGVERNEPIDAQIVQEKFAALALEIAQMTGQPQTPEKVAEGFLAIAVDNMANAIKYISLQRGYDLSAYTLCCFGSAGGQHACAIAERLGIQQIVIHPLAGVLSAYGMGLADLRVCRQQSVDVPLPDCSQLLPTLAQLEAAATQELVRQGVDPLDCRVLRKAYLRLQGSDSALAVPWENADTMQAAFAAHHQQLYGFTPTHLDLKRALKVDSLWVEAIGGAAEPEISSQAFCFSPFNPSLSNPSPFNPSLSNRTDSQPFPVQQVRIYTHGEWHQTPVYERSALKRGDRILGPALIIEPTGTNMLEPNWQAMLTKTGQLLLQHTPPVPRSQTQTQGSGQDLSESCNSPDPVWLEIFGNQFRAIAEQMGVTLQNTSTSVNIKERLDFSCAIFDKEGQLVANAPHIPVHLGSMGDSVQAVRQVYGDCMASGDAFVLNDPYQGGTHLPDITVVTPAFTSEATVHPDSRSSCSCPSFYVASRGHHADIGGITPGSMPPHSTHISQEGILIPPTVLMRQGQIQTSALLTLLNSGDYPARNPLQNLADLQAQLAANQKGVQALQRMVAQYGLDTVQAYMQHIQDYAEQSVRRVIDRLLTQHPTGQFTYPTDEDSQIQVQITFNAQERSARVDFTGTSVQQTSNSNAPAAVAKATVLYVFRTLVTESIPLNAGCLKPLEIILPKGSLLNPTYPAAVVAGNVETSQAIANALYGALDITAASQGTMNNLTFGTHQYQYYETICGGSGAGAYFHGTDAVQTHMTNSRLTDPEVLEGRFPVLVKEFAIRPRSGGQGRYRGGDGVIRRIEFQETMTISVLSGHRRIAPFGLQGGMPGKPGHNSLISAVNNSCTILAGRFTLTAQQGDCLVLETPGGGGYGLPSLPLASDLGK
ncbi:MAG: hydantoinase B/oxoprolinase family protein [Thermosynechococcaceae cyanobacterium MS004]|nr:hydantoinase B/oxoprolinase family protein [Thermosynechococcaceae cyanobacterium MS004]